MRSPACLLAHHKHRFYSYPLAQRVKTVGHPHARYPIVELPSSLPSPPSLPPFGRFVFASMALLENRDQDQGISGHLREAWCRFWLHLSRFST